MAQAYTPGLKVTRRMRHRARRLLPIAGEVLVKEGDHVDARDVVAQTFMPGDALPINVANALALSPGDVPGCMLKQQGDRVEVGDLLARTKGIFGWFKRDYNSKAAGTLESVSSITGQVILRGEPIPVQVRAFLSGEVVEVLPGQGVVIEAETTFIQGIFGVGGEAYGPIRMACPAQTDELTEKTITSQMRGAIVVGGARMTGAAVRRGIEVGAAALVSGGIDDQDLKEILGYDLGVAVTGSEKIGITLIITEGFGPIAMAERTFKLLASREGEQAAVSGATQIRAGVMRPEIVIPLGEDASGEPESPFVVGSLEPGKSVRIIRDPHFGVLGRVAGLPHELYTLPSGSKARVLEVSLDTGETITVPRANVELIEE